MSSRPNRAVLNEKNEVVPVDDLIAWAKQFETMNRRVAQDYVGEARISTVFLGLNHNAWFDGPDLWFETMVFGGPLDGEQERCETHAQAIQMHADMKRKVEAAK